MSAVDTRRPPPAETQAAGEHRGPPSYALQAVASSVCTVLGELLGSSVTGKLVAGILGAWLGAFLTAPGRRHGRRIVAVGILLFSPLDFPIGRLPDWLQLVHRIQPVKYMADLIRWSVTGRFVTDVGLAFAVVGAWCVLGLAVTYRVATRRR